MAWCSLSDRLRPPRPQEDDPSSAVLAVPFFVASLETCLAEKSDLIYFFPQKKLVSFWISSLLCPTTATASAREGQEQGTRHGRASHLGASSWWLKALCETVTLSPVRSILFLSTLLQTGGITQCVAVQGDAGSGPRSAWAVFAAEPLRYGHPARKAPALGTTSSACSFFFIFFSTPSHKCGLLDRACALSRGYCTQFPPQLL